MTQFALTFARLNELTKAVEIIANSVELTPIIKGEIIGEICDLICETAEDIPQTI